VITIPRVRLRPTRLWSTEAQLVLELHWGEVGRPERSYALRLVGPFCHGRRTVSSVYTATPEAEEVNVQRFAMVITEPCYWTPAEPFCYWLQLAGSPFGGQSDIQWLVGLRHIGVDASGLLLTGARWEPQAVWLGNRRLGPKALVARARNEGVDTLVGSVDGKLATLASERGVALIAVVGRGEAAEAVRQYGLAPAVVAWAVDDPEEAAALRRLDGTRPIASLGPAAEDIAEFVLSKHASSAAGHKPCIVVRDWQAAAS